MSISPFEDDRDYPVSRAVSCRIEPFSPGPRTDGAIPGTMRINDTPISEFEAPVAWTFEDQRQAHLRGWSIMDLPDEGPQIIRSDFVDVFDTDAEAAAHVEAHRNDSALCAKAADHVEQAFKVWFAANMKVAA